MCALTELREAFTGELADFGFFMEAEVGPDPGSGGDQFGFTVCSPEWLERRCGTEGFVIGEHHVVVRAQNYSNRALQSYLERWVTSVQGSDWTELAGKLRGFGKWEFEDYVDRPDRP